MKHPYPGPQDDNDEPSGACLVMLFTFVMVACGMAGAAIYVLTGG